VGNESLSNCLLFLYVCVSGWRFPEGSPVKYLLLDLLDLDFLDLSRETLRLAGL